MKGCEWKVSVETMKKPPVTSSTFSFLKENVLSVTDVTRTKMLSEILNKYAGKETSEVYVIQNSKNRNAVGVLVDLEHYERLLRIQEALEQAIDESMTNLVLSRKNEIADIALFEVIDDNDFDLDDLVKALPDIE